MNPNRRRDPDKLDDNVLRETTVGQELPCGHRSRKGPVSTTREKMWFRCPEGCGLQEVKIRR